jgi:hypothetical protein
MSGISIGPDLADDGDYAMVVYSNMPDINPATGTANFHRKTMEISSGTGTDPETLDATSGIMLRGIGSVADGPGTDITRLSCHGISATGKGYEVGSLVGYGINANGLFLTHYTTSDSGKIVAGIYCRALNAGTSLTLAAYFDGDTMARGVQTAKGYCIDPAGQFDCANSATISMPTAYNFYTNKNSAQNQIWNLPDPSSYKPLEQIELVNVNGYGLTVLPLSGDKINSFTGKKILISTVSGCCTLRSNGTDTWYITSISGSFVDV